ncbi:hypothetical protein PWT90_00252 [Aphanocladium album]|nr:hypothetical protein PWT90_00252 [Aphanocladium album]
MQAMDCHSKLAEIKLVSKYYPVGNYSYPRKEDGSAPVSPTSPTISRRDRGSIGSEGSTPGLIDDRTDSEVSQEDDYQYHAHATELWNSFWQPGGEWRLEEDTQVDLPLPAKESYPALIPSPQHKRKPSLKPVETKNPSWPLPKARKPAATYSAFPSIRRQPSRSSLVPTPLSPRSPVTNNFAGLCLPPPPRPERPDALLTPCLEQPPMAPAALATSAPVKQPSRAENRPKTSLDSRISRDIANIFGILGAASRSSEDLTKVSSSSSARTQEQPAHRAARHYKSTTYLGAARQQQQLRQRQQVSQPPLPAEPHSVFEDDSDCEEESAGISFFRFHKRSGSDKSYKASSSAAAAATQEAALTRNRRNRADTIPVPSTTKPPSSERGRGVDVFGRMLGRRSR